MTVLDAGNYQIEVKSKINRANYNYDNITYFTTSKGKAKLNKLKDIKLQLFTDKDQLRTKASLIGFHKVIRKTLLYSRIKQDTFYCPFCGHTANADYQASYNIGNKWFKNQLDSSSL